MSHEETPQEGQSVQTGQTGMNFQLANKRSANAVIKVIGVGGGGGNAVEWMATQGVEGVDFIAANTDRQALLELERTPTTLQLGVATTKGLGAGTDPEVGRAAALEDRDQIVHALEGADMVFVAAGMGGGTGTGAAPVVAQIAQGLDILTVAVVTKPFDFENRTAAANAGIEELGAHVDSLLAIPNDKLFELHGFDDSTTLEVAFAAANDVLRGAVQGIADIIIRPGQMNVDFADVRTVMSEKGPAIMGTGLASGEDRWREATHRAIHNPLLDDIDLRGARGVVVNISTAGSPGIMEFRKVGDTIRDLSASDCTVVVGTAIDPDLDDAMRVTVVATGLGSPRQVAPPPRPDSDPPAPPARGGRHDDFEEFEPPAVHRNRMRAAGGGGAEAQDAEILDIPAFLTRQAD